MFPYGVLASKASCLVGPHHGIECKSWVKKCGLLYASEVMYMTSGLYVAPCQKCKRPFTEANPPSPLQVVHMQGACPHQESTRVRVGKCRPCSQVRIAENPFQRPPLSQARIKYQNNESVKQRAPPLCGLQNVGSPSWTLTVHAGAD